MVLLGGEHGRNGHHCSAYDNGMHSAKYTTKLFRVNFVTGDFEGYQPLGFNL